MPKGYPNSSLSKPCEWCGNEFKYFLSAEKKGHARYCGVSCQRAWQSKIKKGTTTHKITDAIRENYRRAHLGLPNKSRGKPRPHIRGEKNPMWKGGISSENEKQRKTFRYKQWRTAVFQRDNYTCQICGQYSGVLHADHVERWANNEELRYAVTNGRTLCVPCHYYITFKRKMSPGTNWCGFMVKKEG